MRPGTLPVPDGECVVCREPATKLWTVDDETYSLCPTCAQLALEATENVGSRLILSRRQIDGWFFKEHHRYPTLTEAIERRLNSWGYVEYLFGSESFVRNRP